MREKRKRLADPGLVVLDTQSVQPAVGVPATMTGKDAAKRLPGRKRCVAVDVLGLVIGCAVLPASAHENTAGIALLDGVAGQCDTVTKALVDQGFKKKVIDHRKAHGIDVVIVERTPADKGFVPAGQAVDRGADEREPDVQPPPRTRRAGAEAGSDSDAVLEAALTLDHRALAEELTPLVAAGTLTAMFVHTDEVDRALAARVVLTSPEY
ncbi:transposase [Streptomyces sp. NPDC096094]|uniref:transposase n=1 Tax=Streptomyces sp. NPDC096094 TaxID=3366073 RepID=UPI0038243715